MRENIKRRKNIRRMKNKNIIRNRSEMGRNVNQNKMREFKRQKESNVIMNRWISNRKNRSKNKISLWNRNQSNNN